MPAIQSQALCVACQVARPRDLFAWLFVPFLVLDGIPRQCPSSEVVMDSLQVVHRHRQTRCRATVFHQSTLGFGKKEKVTTWIESVMPSAMFELSELVV